MLRSARWWLVVPTICGFTVGCGLPEGDEVFGGYDEATEPLSGVDCGPDAVACSNVGNSVDVYTALYRIGASGLGRSEVAQTFTGVSGTLASVDLKLRLLRDVPEGEAPKIWVAVRELGTGGEIPTSDAASLWKSSGLDAPDVSRGLPETVTVALSAVGTPGPLLATKSYALVVWVDPPTSGDAFLGVASHKNASTYANGKALRRQFRRTSVDDSFPTKEFRDDGADLDLSFALRLAPTTCNELLIRDSSNEDGLYSIDPDGIGPKAARPTWCDMTESGGWTLAVNIASDLGPIDLSAYNLRDETPLSGNYGILLNDFARSTETVYRLTCVEASDGTSRELFLKGLVATEPIFRASGTVTKTAIRCATNPDFIGGAQEGSCLSSDDDLHTYYYLASSDVMWALYSPGPAYTLRHCAARGNGYFSTGRLWFR